MTRIETGTTTRRLGFVARDEADLNTRLPGLTLGSFTVYGRHNGVSLTWTAPTIVEISAGTRPGEYELVVNQDTTITPGVDSEEIILSIQYPGMETVTRVFELYRPKATMGETVGVSGGNVALQDGSLTSAKFAAGAINPTVAPNLDAAVSSRGSNDNLLALSVLAETIDDNTQGLRDAYTDLRAEALDNLDRPVSEIEASFDDEAAIKIAGKVVAQRGEFYPPRELVWVLQRTGSGIVVRDDHVISKGASEKVKCWIDFAALLGRNEGIESLDVMTVTGSTFTKVAASDSVLANLTYLVIEGGESGQAGTVTCEITTTAGQELACEVQIAVP